MSDSRKSPDSEFMKAALKLAAKAEGLTSPNPLVGAVLVKKGRIIGKGYHKKAGLPHAEIEAFRDAESKNHDVRSCTLYVNLEPCCHDRKRTPPCTDAIIERGVGRVVVGTLDPNPRVGGKGVSILRKNGISVDVGILEEECRKLNEIFFKHITTGTPFVILKLACSLDGKIATVTGDSKWIGSTNQRKIAHRLRNRVDAVLVGINTIENDNPRLNVRLKKRNISQPVPVVVDSNLRISPDANIFRVHNAPVIVTTNNAPLSKLKIIGENTRVLRVSQNRSGEIDLREMLGKLSDIGIYSLLIEGGSSIAGSAVNSKIVDKMVFFYSPKLVGGDGLNMFPGLGVTEMADSVNLKEVNFRKFGDEFMVEGYPVWGNADTE